MADSVIYADTEIPKELFERLNNELKLPQVKNLTASAHPRRFASLYEALSWKSGPSQDKRETTRLYHHDGFDVGARKPGKEAAPEYNRIKHYKNCPCCSGELEGTNNPNDMLPIILKNDQMVPDTQPWTFEYMFNSIEKLMRQDTLGIELLGSILFRMAFMIDHKEENGNWRLELPETTVSELEKRIPTIGDVPARVFIYFLEILAINEDIKVHTLGYVDIKQLKPQTKKGFSFVDYGRTNTLLTFCHLIAVLLMKKPLSKFAYSFARPPSGMAPLPKTKGSEVFELLSNSKRQVTF